MNPFWTLIWCRAILNSQNTIYNTSKLHIDLINKVFNKKLQINFSEIDERINMLITIYGAKDIFQIIKIPDGDYSADTFKAISVGGKARLAIITGDFERKINLCHMGRPKVVPHIALSSILNPMYRAVPTGEPVVFIDNDGQTKIKQSDKIYIDKIKNLQERYKNASENSGPNAELKLQKIKNEFKKLGKFTDKNGLEWISCISPCVCLTKDGISESCASNRSSCNSTGKFLSVPEHEKINRPSVINVKFPPLSDRELKYLFSHTIEKFKKKSAAQYPYKSSENITNEQIRKRLEKEVVPWEMGQWFIRVNPKSVGYKIAQQNNTLVATGISNHARLIMDFLSTFIPFTNFNNKQLLTARLVSTLIQPVHHTFNEVLKSVEYLGINYDPSISEEDSVKKLLTRENDGKINDLENLFGSISYQTIVPYLKQNEYNKLQLQTGKKSNLRPTANKDLKDWGRQVPLLPVFPGIIEKPIVSRPERFRPGTQGLRRRSPYKAKGGKTKKRKYRKRKTRKIPT